VEIGRYLIMKEKGAFGISPALVAYYTSGAGLGGCFLEHRSGFWELGIE
jgi:hypothetical protein